MSLVHPQRESLGSCNSARRLILICCNLFHEIPPHSFISSSSPGWPSQLLLQQYPGPFVGLDKKSRYDVMTAFLSTKFLLKRKKNREPYRIVLG